MSDQTEDFKPTPLDNIMADQAPEPAPQPEPEPAPETPSEPEKGEEPEPDQPEPDSVPPAPDEDDEPKDTAGLLAALKDERRKRQDFEREFKDLKSRVDQPKTEEIPDEYDDPEGFKAYQDRQDALKEYRVRADMSRAIFMSQHEDYEEAEQAFADAVKANPALAQQVVSHPIPAQFAYEEGKRQMFLSKIGKDPSKYEEQIRADERAKVEAELKANLSKQKTEQAAELVPKSLAGATSAGERDASKQAFEPTPLDSIIPP